MTTLSLRSRVLFVLVAVLLSVLAVGALTQPQAAQAATKKSALDNGLTYTAAGAKSALGKMKVVKPASMSGYSREKFPHWRDASTWGWPVAPSNSCDARQATLYRDGIKVKVNSNCTPTSGYWIDPYTGSKITASRSVDVDHVVPLAAAWRAGANKWATEQRTKFANAPLVLVATGASANRAKGDKGPEAWKPADKAVHCSYARRWVQVKAQWKLTLTSESERTALKAMLKTC